MGLWVLLWNGPLKSHSTGKFHYFIKLSEMHHRSQNAHLSPTALEMNANISSFRSITLFPAPNTSLKCYPSSWKISFRVQVLPYHQALVTFQNSGIGDSKIYIFRRKSDLIRWWACFFLFKPPFTQHYTEKCITFPFSAAYKKKSVQWYKFSVS